VVVAVDWVAGFAEVAAVLAAALIAGALIWRFVRAGLHREGHRRALAPVDISAAFPAPDLDVA
jgi:peptidoglycan/LPS O-acetylase OafA/YrhL